MGPTIQKLKLSINEPNSYNKQPNILPHMQPRLGHPGTVEQDEQTQTNKVHKDRHSDSTRFESETSWNQNSYTIGIVGLPIIHKE